MTVRQADHAYMVPEPDSEPAKVRLESLTYNEPAKVRLESLTYNEPAKVRLESLTYNSFDLAGERKSTRYER